MIPSQPPLYARQGKAWKNSDIQTEHTRQSKDYFGHKIRKKKDNTMRILLSNPNGITGSNHSNKIERIKQKSLAYQLDALCLVEHNQNFRRLPSHKQLKNVTQGWWQHRRVCQTFNKHFDSGKEQQVGGASIIAINSIAHRSANIQHDPTGLGRWTSMLIKGKQGFLTRIVCVYRPCKSTGPDTAYIQHVLYFNKINRKGDPRNFFMHDLAEAINNWQLKGEKIILTGDFNTGDKTTVKSKQRFWQPWLEKTGLVDVNQIFSNGIEPPSTHERGRVQIDYMFVSPGITVKRAGFLPFSKLPGDHRAVWMDISLKDVIGYIPPPLALYHARRLKLQDPRIVLKYIHHLKSLLNNQQTLAYIHQLSEIPSTAWTAEHTQQYQQLALTFRSAMMEAERNCRKFHTGAHPWSPILDDARKRQFYWELSIKKLQGLHVPTRKLLKISKRLKISNPPCSLASAIANQTLARRHYQKIKRQSCRHRITFRENLAEAISTHSNVAYSSVLRNLINREEIRDMHRRIKWMRGKYKGLSTSGVLISQKKGRKFLFLIKIN